MQNNCIPKQLPCIKYYQGENVIELVVKKQTFSRLFTTSTLSATAFVMVHFFHRLIKVDGRNIPKGFPLATST